MMNKGYGRGLKLLLGMGAFAACFTVIAADAQQMGRNPWTFRVIDNPIALNRVVVMEQKKADGFAGTRVWNNTQVTTVSNVSQAIENFTEVLNQCGNDANCAVDATVNRSGTGGNQSSDSAQNVNGIPNDGTLQAAPQ